MNLYFNVNSYSIRNYRIKYDRGVKMSKNGARLVKLDWDKECEMDFIMGRGFEVTEPAFKGKDQKSMYGIQSPIF